MKRYNFGKAIIIWPFEDAPETLQNMSPHGGDEDWVALIPAVLKNTGLSWMEEGTSFGCCRVSEHELPNGDQVRIGAHA